MPPVWLTLRKRQLCPGAQAFATGTVTQRCTGTATFRAGSSDRKENHASFVPCVHGLGGRFCRTVGGLVGRSGACASAAAGGRDVCRRTGAAAVSCLGSGSGGTGAGATRQPLAGGIGGADAGGHAAVLPEHRRPHPGLGGTGGGLIAARALTAFGRRGGLPQQTVCRSAPRRANSEQPLSCE